MKQKSKKKNRGLGAVLAVLFVMIAALIGAIIYYQVGGSQPQATTAAPSAAGESTAPQEAEAADAAAYYSENAQKLLAVTPAQSAAQIYSEKALCKELAARGFGEDTAVTSRYEMDGSVRDNTEIDNSSDAAHPEYSFTYITEIGDYWTVSVCNDCVTAYPVTYNLEHGDGAEVIITEGESITSYDSAANCFYETIPKQSVLVVKQIPAITADALEKLTAQEIETL